MRPFILAILALFAVRVTADIQFSNGPALDAQTTDGSRFTSTGNIRSLGFTIPADGPSYRLEEVELTLTYTQNIPARVELWQGAGAPASLVAPLVTILPPAGQWGFPYEPTSRVELLPGITYWIRVSASGPGSDFFWNAKNPAINPDGVFDFVGYHNSSGPPRTQRNTAIIRADAILIDNMNAAPGSGTALPGQPLPSRKAAGFTPPPGQDWLLRDIIFSLSGTGAQPRVSLFNGITPGPHRDTRLGSLFSGTFDLRVQYTDLLLRLRALERWWIELRAGNAETLTWRGTTPNTLPTGAASSNGFRLNGHPNSVANRFEVFATPLLGINAPETDVLMGIGHDDVILTEIILPPGRTATIHGVGLRFVHPSGAHDFTLQLWTGATEPETLLTTFIDHDIIHSSLLTLFAARNPTTLVPQQRYWIRFLNAFGGTQIAAHQTLSQMDGILRVGPSTDDDVLDETPFLIITGTGSIQCQADLSGSADPQDFAYGIPDGLVDSADTFFYLDQFDLGVQSRADLTATADPLDPLYGFPDGVVDADDFFFYLDLFDAGCP